MFEIRKNDDGTVDGIVGEGNFKLDQMAADIGSYTSMASGCFLRRM